MTHRPEPQRAENPRVPQATRPLNHSLDIQTRFTDFDMYGHLNNNVYLSYADLAKVAYFERLAPQGLSPRATLNLVVAHLSTDFYAPTVPGEKVRVLTAVTALGERTVTLEQRIVSRPEGWTKCIVTTVMVAVDPVTARSARLNPDWEAAFRAYEHL